MAEVRANREKKRAILDGGRTGADGQMSESIGANIEKVKKYRAEKRSLIDSLKDMNERLRILDA